MQEEEQIFEHPSYGMVGFNRWQGGGYIPFGSAIRVHNGISLTIMRAQRRHSLSRDWFFGRKELIEISLTESQFAQLICSMGVGDGVPCTIRHVGGEQAPLPPQDVPSEATLVHDKIESSAGDVADLLRKRTQEMRDIMANSKMSAKDKTALKNALDMFVQEVESNLPFLIGQLREAADHVVTQCKTEVMAFTDRVLRSTGLEHLRKDAPQMIETDKKE